VCASFGIATSQRKDFLNGSTIYSVLATQQFQKPYMPDRSNQTVDQPLLSILITHYNRPDFLRRLIDALRKLQLLAQFEVIVSDDGSDDEAASAISDLPIDKLVRSELNCGLANNINKGIKACSGEFIMYCQEDFVPVADLSKDLTGFFGLLRTGDLDMIRLTANYKFPKLMPISDDVSLIPRLSVRNYLYNHFRYSDHPFLVRSDFFDRFGFYLEGTSTLFGESEYMVRIMRSKAKIGISNTYYFRQQDLGRSVRDDNRLTKTDRLRRPASLKRQMRALRYFFEFLMYDQHRRGLKTYRNFREGQNA
jgi:glycosyltransferase involved in cell wall biosynthesis